MSDEIQALREALQAAIARAERAEAALAERALTEDEWGTIERRRALRAKQAACPHLSIEAGSERCLACGL